MNIEVHPARFGLVASLSIVPAYLRQQHQRYSTFWSWSWHRTFDAYYVWMCGFNMLACAQPTHALGWVAFGNTRWFVDDPQLVSPSGLGTS